MKLRFLEDAKIELAEAKAWYNRERSGLGNAFVREVKTTIAKVAKNPEQWAEIEPGIRCCQTARFPYGLIYIVRRNELLVLAVMHLHREPGYWRNRL